MKEVINKPVDELKIKIQNIEDIEKIKNLNLEGGKTTVKIDVEINKKTLSFKLKDYRKIDHKTLNLLRNNQNIKIS